MVNEIPKVCETCKYLNVDENVCAAPAPWKSDEPGYIDGQCLDWVDLIPGHIRTWKERIK